MYIEPTFSDIRFDEEMIDLGKESIRFKIEKKEKDCFCSQLLNSRSMYVMHLLVGLLVEAVP